MTVVNGSKHPLRVAIIGGGPAGLAAAIELSKLPFVEWTLYEKKPEISETGGGISMQRNTWRMLEAMDVAKNISAKDFFRPYDGHYVQHRYVTLEANIAAWV
jgi:salicylate hydroxylase